tara:strand:+ start:8706 stop:9293 length:588 start_codon:yes stop_codon:yes gene_type:complete
MFDGIIYDIGKVSEISKLSKSIFIGIKTKMKFKKNEVGSSICCNGVCLTLVNVKKNIIYFYISKETLYRSNFKSLKINDFINLEKSIIFGQKISGNFTQGHVDTTALVYSVKIIDQTWVVKFKIKDFNLAKLLVEKASISVNGVSLTISKSQKNYFEVNIIPHTLKLTNLKNIKKGDIVNIELDIFSKYISKISN